MQMRPVLVLLNVVAQSKKGRLCEASQHELRCRLGALPVLLNRYTIFRLPLSQAAGVTAAGFGVEFTVIAFSWSFCLRFRSSAGGNSRRDAALGPSAEE